jgi:hypothetical protein
MTECPECHHSKSSHWLGECAVYHTCLACNHIWIEQLPKCSIKDERNDHDNRI